MRKKILLFTVLLALICASFLVAVKVNAFEPLDQLIPKMKIPIPQLEPFQKPTYVEEEGKGYIFIPWIAQYISAMYKYALAIGSILAVISVMVGGILYLTSGGAQARIDQGKKIIIGAITGLLIIVFSYIFLNTINPELINLKPIRIQAVVQEQLTVGAFCKDLGSGFIVKTPSGEKEGTSGNDKHFACGKSYPVRSGAADVIVPEGQTCDGSYCAPTEGECVNGDCMKALFRGKIGGMMRNFNKYIDEGNITVRGMPGNKVIAVVPVGKDDKEYTLGLNTVWENNLKSVDKVFFHFEANNQGCYAELSYALLKNPNIDLVNVLKIATLKCFLKPTIDNDYYAVKSYKNDEQAIWGFPYEAMQTMTTGMAFSHDTTPCDPCFILDRNPSSNKFMQLPYCKFWDAKEVLRAAKEGSGTVVNFNLDDFADLPPPISVLHKLVGVDFLLPPLKADQELLYKESGGTNDIQHVDWDKVSQTHPEFYPYLLHSVESCIYSPDIYTSVETPSNLPSLPGTPCRESQLFDIKTINAVEGISISPDLINKTVTCRPKTDSTLEWVLSPKSNSGEPCDNLTNANNFNVPTPMKWKTQIIAAYDANKVSQECDGSKNLICKFNKAPSLCDGSTGAGIYYCYGSCEDKDAGDLIKPGDMCSADKKCPTYKGQIMSCVESINTCVLGLWGDPCDNTNDCFSGYECIEHDTATTDPTKFCAKKSAETWQACGEIVGGDTNNCGPGKDCKQVEYHVQSDSDTYCGISTNADTNGVKFCLTQAFNQDVTGICSCNNDSDCANTYEWNPGASFCAKQGSFNFCTEIKEGAWCRPDADVPNGYDCRNISAGYGVLRQKQQ